jgi:hypothetical protein
MSKSEAAKAEEFVRSVLKDTFHQKVSDRQVKDVAQRVARLASLEEAVPVKRRA